MADSFTVCPTDGPQVPIWGTRGRLLDDRRRLYLLVNQDLMGPADGGDLPLAFEWRHAAIPPWPIPSWFVRRMVRQSPFEAQGSRDSPTIR